MILFTFLNSAVLNSRGMDQDMIYMHKVTGKKVAVPRHTEIKNKFLKKILNEISKKE
jgi:hypothetical protein